MATVNSDFVILLLVLAVLGGLLLVFSSPITQGFVNPPSGPQACGVDLAPCAAGKKCINGFCRKAAPSSREDKHPVPLLSDPIDNSYAPLE